MISTTALRTGDRRLSLFLLHPPIAPWAVADTEGLELSLLTDADLDAGRVFVRTLPDNEELLTPMVAAGRSGELRRWTARVAWDRGNEVTLYAFVAVDADGAHWLAADGRHAHVPPESVQFRAHPTQRPPDWVRSQVFYQVFPDRFARGAAAVDRSGEWLHGPRRLPVVQPPWGAPVDPRHAANAFYGGDLPGLTQRLPYLADELGVSAIYLNPVFAAASNHRYDTSDYGAVDPHLGGDAALAALRAATRERGMRLLLDAVVNHTGIDHPWYDRWGRHAEPGAAQSTQSRWRGHYAWDEAGRVQGWKGHEGLPVLDYASPALQQDVYGAPDAILRRWLRPPYAIDGWRLDVVHMLGEGAGARNNAHHVRAIRRALREENADAYVLGEHFAEATRWLQGDQEDGAMNYYGHAGPVRAWLAGIELAGRRVPIATAAFESWMTRAQAAIPYANQLAQLNLLDSHDTPRLLTELGGDVAAMQIAVTLLCTRPGVPCIYYGDEIGLEGGADPDCRRCFDWDRAHWNTALWAHYRTLVRLRRERAEWADGATLTLARGPDWLVYARYTEHAATLVAVNRGAGAEIELPLTRLPLTVARWRRVGGGDVAGAGLLRLTLPARAGAIWLG